MGENIDLLYIGSSDFGSAIFDDSVSYKSSTIRCKINIRQIYSLAENNLEASYDV
jgi:hypothetical protein